MPPTPSAKFAASAEEIARAQLTFDWLIPFSPAKQLLNTTEAARILSVSDETVRQLIESGQLEAHGFNASGATERETNRVTRRSITVFLLRSAKHESDAIVASLLDICRRQLSSAQREAFLAGLHTPPARR